MSLPQDPDHGLQAAREAHARFAWREAFDLFTAADAGATLSPQDLEHLGAAAWWNGRLPACISARERAYAAYVQVSNRRRAGLMASELTRDYFAKGDPSVGQAWLNRAERLLQEEPESVEHGYLARMRAVVAFEGRRDFEAALIEAERALAIGTRLGDRELMAIALHDRGRVLVAKGRVAEGLALIDEATVAAVTEALGPLATAIIYCNTITACVGLADYPRAREWTDAAKRWCDRQAIAGFPGMCRVYRAGIMRLGGAWPEAEQEARRACDELREFNRGYYAEALSEVGLIRLRLGDLAAAEEAFRQAHELGHESEPGRSLLRLAEGKTKAAVASIKRALGDEQLDRLHRARLLPARVHIAVAAGDLDDAHAAAEELDAIATAYGTPALQADAAQARGAVLLARGDGAGAQRRLRRAVHLWQDVECPYEVANARMLLASTYQTEGDIDTAVLELQAARSTFERLGAELDVRRADALLGDDAAGRRVARTFMFTDIVKSTSLVEAIGDEAWSDLLHWHDQTLRALFMRHGGEEVDHAGDGFFVAFADPSAALECAVAVQRTLAEHRRNHGFAPRVRIGLHTAPAQRHDAGYKGKGVHEASRIAGLAEGDQILASRETTAAPGRIVTSQPRTVPLAGLGEPVEIVTVEWR